jgi:hypothetical protein
LSGFYSTGEFQQTSNRSRCGAAFLDWFIVIFVIFLALAPLWHFAPSKGQRRAARLRETAALAGLFVEFRDLPLPPARLERMPRAERQVLYYGCRLRAQRGNPPARVAWWRDGEHWSSHPPRREAPPQARLLPPSVLAIEVSPASCGVYWREEGDEDEVENLARILGDWRDSLTQP